MKHPIKLLKEGWTVVKDNIIIKEDFFSAALGKGTGLVTIPSGKEGKEGKRKWPFQFFLLEGGDFIPSSPAFSRRRKSRDGVISFSSSGKSLHAGFHSMGYFRAAEKEGAARGFEREGKERALPFARVAGRRVVSGLRRRRRKA